jgi:hypothetical protein
MTTIQTLSKHVTRIGRDARLYLTSLGVLRLGGALNSAVFSASWRLGGVLNSAVFSAS